MEKPKYVPIDCGFHDILLAKASVSDYCKIQYFSDIHELITVTSIIKDVFTVNKEEFARLASGETIRLDAIVSIAGNVSPNYLGFYDFSCDC
jgi:Rho-binding antiterminator